MSGNKSKMIRGWCRLIWKDTLAIEKTRFYRRVKQFYAQKHKMPELRDIVGY